MTTSLAAAAGAVAVATTAAGGAGNYGGGAADAGSDLTSGQANAVSSAEDYLSMSGFSRSGLIEQLKYEGFTPEQAEYGVSQAGF